MTEAPSLIPDEFENIKNDPVAFIKFMIPDLKIEPWQREILRNMEDPRWQGIIFKGRR